MANRFWVGGTGTWDATNNGHWSTTSNGTGNQAAPVAGDVVTFDANSGGGTVTVNTTVSVASISCGAFTGTLDFSAHNNNVTLSGNVGFNGTGSGARTINLGNGTWTLTGTGSLWNFSTTTNLTFNANSSVLVFTATTALTRTFQSGSLSYSTITISANSSGGVFNYTVSTGTIATLNITGQNAFIVTASATLTITNAFTWTGTSGSEIYLASSSVGNQATIAVASGSPAMSWAGVRDIAFNGGATFAASNSFNLGNNSGITITAPTSGMLFQPDLAGT